MLMDFWTWELRGHKTHITSRFHLLLPFGVHSIIHELMELVPFSKHPQDSMDLTRESSGIRSPKQVAKCPPAACPQ
jgi:hypothetical protein